MLDIYFSFLFSSFFYIYFFIYIFFVLFYVYVFLLYLCEVWLGICFRKVGLGTVREYKMGWCPYRPIESGEG
jgi:hypothetical protein